jgi:hypothetical protein
MRSLADCADSHLPFLRALQSTDDTHNEAIGKKQEMGQGNGAGGRATEMRRLVLAAGFSPVGLL